MTRHHLAIAVLCCALVGCSSPSDSPGSSSETPGPGGGQTTEPTSVGAVDCDILQDPTVETDLLGIQILAQLRNQDVVDSLNSGVLNYDPTSMALTLEKLRVLAGHGVPGLGDPGEAIDFYQGANAIAIEIMAIDGPVPQEKFDELIAYEGELGDFLMKQVAINAALSENCS